MFSRKGLITGCGKGIGLAIAKKILKNETNTLVFGISRTFNKEIEELQNEYYPRFLFNEANISDFKNIESIIKKINDEYISLDFAICNAGNRSRCSVLDSEIDLFKSILEVNTISNINIAKLLIQNSLYKKKKLNLLFVSSIVGSRGFNELSTYAVSKSALEGFMKSAAIEFAKNNIQINCIAPGFVESSYASNFRYSQPELYKWTIEQTPMGRWGTCDEIANVAVFTVSEINSFMTGSVIYCDGGWTAK